MAETPASGTLSISFTELETYGFYLGILNTLKTFEAWRDESPETNGSAFERFARTLLESVRINETLSRELPDVAFFQKSLRDRLEAGESGCFAEAAFELLLARQLLFPEYLKRLYKAHPLPDVQAEELH